MTNPFEGKTYAEAIDLITKRYGERTALVFRDRRYTFQDAAKCIEAASRRLASLGLSPGATLAIWMPNRPEFIWYWLGAARIGLIVVFVNTRLKRAEFMYQLAQSECRAVITVGPGGFRDFMGELKDACGDISIGPDGSIKSAALPNLQRIISVDPLQSADGFTTDWSVPDGSQSPEPALETNPDKPALIAYSSGTTALPKGAMLTHCVFRKAWDGGVKFDMSPDDALYLCVPVFGVLGFLSGILLFWTHGAKVVLEDRFEAGNCLRQIEGEGCSFIHLLPVMIDHLLAHPDFSNRDTSRLRAGVVLSNDPDVMRKAVLKLGIRGATAGYGMTESTGLVTRGIWNAPLEERLKSHGTPLPGCSIRVVDPETTNDLPPGERGEIWVGGYSVMAGYFNKPDETAATITRDGWLRTGDLGYMNDDGSLVFLHRLKDGYKYKGFNVSTTEVEACLLAHSAVGEAAVVPMPHDSFGHIGIAFVVAKAGCKLNIDDITRHIRENLSSFKQPAAIYAIDQMPRTGGTEKIQKFKLQEIAAKAMTE